MYYVFKTEQLKVWNHVRTALHRWLNTTKFIIYSCPGSVDTC